MALKRKITHTTEVRFKLKSDVNDKLKKVKAFMLLTKSTNKNLEELYGEAMEIGTNVLLEQNKIAV